MILTSEQLGVLTLVRYEVTLRAQVETVLPPFLGSTLRGAWGHALKAVACSMPHGDCGRCLLVERCLYPRLFETSARNLNEVSLSGERSNGSGLNSILGNGHGANERAAINPDKLLKQRQDAPRPFIFVPPAPASAAGFMRGRDDFLRWQVRVDKGEPVVFGLSLLGEAVNDLPYVIYAISLMAQHGFGAQRASFALDRVAALDCQGKPKLIYTSGSNRIEGHASSHTSLGRLVQARLATASPIAASQCSVGLVTAAAAPSFAGPGQVSGFRPPVPKQESEIRNEVTLRFVTPTRLRLKGRVVEHPSFAQLISSLSLRLSMLAETFAEEPLSYDYKSMIDRARDITTLDSSLRLMALNRYSNRRGEKLELDGFMGDIRFAGPGIQELLPLLVAGEFFHVGSGTAFGLGRYLVVS